MTDELPAVDDDNLFLPLPRAKQRVIDTIKQLGLRVLPNDVVARTGLPVHEATSLLNKVAAETYATLQVAETGEIIYQFPERFERAYAVRGMEKTLRAFYLATFRMIFFALRISFGVILAISLVVVAVLVIAAVIALIAAAIGGGGDSGGGDLGDLGFGGGDVSVGSASSDVGFFDLGSLGDGFSWNYTDSHQRKIEKYGVAKKTWRPKRQVQKGNFFLECFSFLFGDGDPNANGEEIRWKMVAEVIRANKFVVTAEQIAPYTGNNPTDESGMFGTLARFDGVPIVTDKGNIVYVFDSMRRQMKPLVNGLNIPSYFEENEWQFSEYPAPALINVTIFATLNFAGSWWLLKHIATIALLQHYVLLIDFLFAYGTLFLCIPLIRVLANEMLNQFIRARNAQRKKHAQYLNTQTVRAKLEDARDYARAALPAPEVGKIVYSTDKDLLEQKFERLQ